MEPKAIGYYLTFLSADMAVDGTLWPDMVKVESERKVLELAKEQAKNQDVMECMFGCLTVYDDGTVSHSEYAMDELEN